MKKGLYKSKASTHPCDAGNRTATLLQCNSYMKKFIHILPVIVMVLIFAIFIQYMHCCTDVRYPIVIHYWNLLLDVSVFVALFSLLSIINSKLAYIITITLSLIYMFVNVIYCRFFDQYLTVGVLKQIGNFEGDWWKSYIADTFRYCDLLPLGLYIFSMSCLCFKSFRLSLVALRRYVGLMIVSPLVIMLTGHFLIFPTYAFYKTGEYRIESWDESYGHFFKQSYCIGNHMENLYGFFRTQFYCGISNLFDTYTLPDEQVAQITDHLYACGALSLNKSVTAADNGKNLIFILLESTLSSVVTLSVSGVPVTPNLNELVESNNVKYTGNMAQNITVGESSDGQFIYMTGLHPLPGEITINKLLDKKLIAFPSLMRKQGYSTCITVPTKASFWHQNELNPIYGLDSLVSITGMNGEFACDSLVFDAVSAIQLEQPFMHMILTASTHAPYDKINPNVEPWDIDFPESYSHELCNYLTKCHYMDKYLGRYIATLKQRSLYDNSVIIITSDHEAHNKFLHDHSQAIAPGLLPLFIIGSDDTRNICKTNPEQVDLYPTIIDMFGLDTMWHGLGKNLLIPSRQDDVDKITHTLSAMMIEGNYFKMVSNSVR